MSVENTGILRLLESIMNDIENGVINIISIEETQKVTPIFGDNELPIEVQKGEKSLKIIYEKIGNN